MDAAQERVNGAAALTFSPQIARQGSQASTACNGI